MKIVKINWIDSTTQGGWIEKDAWVAPKTDCITVGFLMEDKEDYISVCQSYHEDQYGEVITIPRVSITKVKELDM